MASHPSHCRCKDRHDRHDRSVAHESSALLHSPEPGMAYSSTFDDSQSVRTAPPPYESYNDGGTDNDGRASAEDVEAQRTHHHSRFRANSQAVMASTRNFTRQIKAYINRVLVLLVVQPLFTIFSLRTWINLASDIRSYISYLWYEVIPAPITSAILGGVIWLCGSVVLSIALFVLLLFVVLGIGIFGCLSILGMQALSRISLWLWEVWKGMVL